MRMLPVARQDSYSAQRLKVSLVAHLLGQLGVIHPLQNVLLEALLPVGAQESTQSSITDELNLPCLIVLMRFKVAAAAAWPHQGGDGTARTAHASSG